MMGLKVMDLLKNSNKMGSACRVTRRHTHIKVLNSLSFLLLPLYINSISATTTFIMRSITCLSLLLFGSVAVAVPTPQYFIPCTNPDGTPYMNPSQGSSLASAGTSTSSTLSTSASSSPVSTTTSPYSAKQPRSQHPLLPAVLSLSACRPVSIPTGRPSSSSPSSAPGSISGSFAGVQCTSDIINATIPASTRWAEADADSALTQANSAWENGSMNADIGKLSFVQVISNVFHGSESLNCAVLEDSCGAPGGCTTVANPGAWKILQSLSNLHVVSLSFVH